MDEFCEPEGYGDVWHVHVYARGTPACGSESAVNADKME
jgi:hypothetical protein